MVLNNVTISVKNMPNAEFKLKYFLIKTKLNELNLYGFRVESYNLKTNEITTKDFLDYTSDIKKAEEVFKMIIENEVSPVNLIQILDEYSL